MGIRVLALGLLYPDAHCLSRGSGKWPMVSQHSGVSESLESDLQAVVLTAGPWARQGAPLGPVRWLFPRVLQGPWVYTWKHLF